MGNEGSDDHGIIRSDFPGGWPSDSDKNAFTGKGLNNDERWAQQRIKALLHLRQTYPQLFQGKLKHYAPVDGVYTYFREAEKGAKRSAPSDNGNNVEKIMVILNKKAVDLPLSTYTEMLKTNDSITRISDGKTFKSTDTISLSAMSANVFIVR